MLAGETGSGKIQQCQALRITKIFPACGKEGLSHLSFIASCGGEVKYIARAQLESRAHGERFCWSLLNVYPVPLISSSHYSPVD